jgi:hypothetical protein
VGGVAVDLQPLHDWKTDHQGERPLKHWREVQVIGLERTVAYPQVVVRMDGQQKTILLRNCPHRLLDSLNQRVGVEKQLNHAKKKTDRARSEVEYASTRAPGTFVVTGNSDFVNSAAVEYEARREELARARAALAEATAEEAKLARQAGELDKTIEGQGALLAMNTGQTLGNLEVWDTGMKGGL